jgi:hypothetical protein
MKGSTITSLAFALFSLTAIADDQGPTIRQWKGSLKSMFELTQSGYHVVAVSSYPGMKADTENYTFVLQKEGDVFRCIEMHFRAPKSRTEHGYFSCSHLVALYAYDAKTDQLEH